jgi:type II secretory ATPase GspE/PulE/Tfp pilus assembly ATPase PilB-like protein
MTSEVILSFRNRRKLRTSLCAPFRPDHNEVSIHISASQKRNIPLDELCYIGMVGTSPPCVECPRDDPPQEVELVTGERLMLRIRHDQVFDNGFFGFSSDDSAPFKRLFIISSAVRPTELRRLAAGAGATPPARAQDPEAAAADTGGQPRDTWKAWSQIVDSPLPHQNARVGDLLITEGLVSKEQVETAMQGSGKKKIGAVLMEQGLVSEGELLEALAKKFCIPFLDLSAVTPSPAALEALPKNLVNQMQVLPIELEGKKLVVATSEPADSTISDSLRFITNHNIELVIATAQQISAAIDRFYNSPGDSIEAVISEMEDEQLVVVEQSDEVDNEEPDSKVILLVNRILLEAFATNASDIHFEPELGKGPLSVRYRVDGECVLSHAIPAVHKNAVVARLKIMAKLDIAERRKPQSGKIFLLYDKRKLEYRVEITPTVEEHEDAVLRLLTAAKPLSLGEMGLSEQNLARFQELVKKPYGLILCVGPTGSGKTTTLHSALATINRPERKIWTAEDPVEIIQKGLRQVQVNPRIGFGFADAMRSFLRADPDVIMIGEMRDTETSKTAIAASLTGHLVFSTLHTNSAPETVARLLEMGIDPFNFSDAMLGIMAQRLTRKLCDHCKKPHRPAREEYEEMVVHYGPPWYRAHGLPERPEDLQLMRRVGCEKCGGTGYRGRVALHELLVNSPATRKAIKANASVEELREVGLQEGSRTLKMDGIEKVLQGVTDLQQVLKVCIV